MDMSISERYTQASLAFSYSRSFKLAKKVYEVTKFRSLLLALY